jgi:hypothetical protein
MSRRVAVRVQAAKPVVMVNSCTGKMGRAVADAAVRAGLTLAPYTLCSENEAGGYVEVAGQQLKLVGPSSRDQIITEVGGVPLLLISNRHDCSFWEEPQSTAEALKPVFTQCSHHSCPVLPLHNPTHAPPLATPTLPWLSILGEAAASQPDYG